MPYGAPPPGYYPYGPPPGYGPQYGPPAEPERPRNSVGMMVGGIIATSVGGVLVPIGALVFAAGSDTSCTCDIDVCSCQEDEPAKVAGVVTIVGGIALVGVGIPLLIVGARRKKPDVPTQQQPTTPEQPPTSAELVAAPGSMGLRVRF